MDPRPVGWVSKKTQHSRSAFRPPLSLGCLSQVLPTTQVVNAPSSSLLPCVPRRPGGWGGGGIKLNSEAPHAERVVSGFFVWPSGEHQVHRPPVRADPWRAPSWGQGESMHTSAGKTTACVSWCPAGSRGSAACAQRGEQPQVHIRQEHSEREGVLEIGIEV